MPSLQDRPAIRFTRTEDDEAIGTVRQFSDRLNLPTSQVVPCLQTHAAPSILLRAGSGPEQVLILDTGGLEALQECAGAAPTTA